MDKTKKLLIAVCAVLTLSIVGIIGYLIGSGGSDKEVSGKDDSRITVTEAQSTDAQTTSAYTEQTEAETVTAEDTAAQTGTATGTVSEAEQTTESAKQEEKPAQKTGSGTPVENHGRLKISGTDIVDKNGEKYQLKGVSTHGLAWFPDFVNKDAFRTIRDDWGGNLIRLAMYTDENLGYCTDGDRAEIKKLVENGVEYATELGMYVIIDWHILHDRSPQTYKAEALKFFEEMAAKYADYENVLYEICNEPNGGTSWADVKSYAEEVIPVIRKYSQNIVIVGTPTWSQDVDRAAEAPLEADNVCYALHFYAATHKGWLRDKLRAAKSAGLPIFISEFSICDASGNGGIDYSEAEEWFKMIDELNLSYAAWNLANKDETSSLIKSSCEKLSDWGEGELSETGVWIRSKIRGE